MNEKQKKTGMEYKWFVALACFLVLFVGVGFCSSAKNIYIAPITSAMGFYRSEYTISDTFRYATTAIATMFLDRLIKRFGEKTVLMAGMLCYVASSLLNSFATVLWMFYLGGVFLGFGMAFAATTMVSIIINKWFKEGKGTIMGVIFASNALGSAVALHFFEPLIYEEGNPFGFRNAYRLTAIIVAFVAVVIMILYRGKNSQNGGDMGAKKAQKRKLEDDWEGFEYDELKRKPSFYILIVCLAIYSISSLSSIAPPYFTDVGFESSFVALTLSVASIGLIFSKILMGIVYDKFKLRVAVNACLWAALISKAVLFVITATTTGKILAIAHSIMRSIAMPMETVMISIIVLDLFGEKSFHKALAIVTSLFTVGHALNQPLMNLAFDISGKYTVSFIVSTIASIAIIILMNYAINSLKRDKKRQMKDVEINV